MKFGIIGNRSKHELPGVVKLLVDTLNRSSVEFVIDGEIVELLNGKNVRLGAVEARKHAECIRGVDIVIALGGDGTILSAARTVGAGSTPILGVNLGKLGFLAEFAPDELETSIKNVIANNYHVEERMVLEATSPSLPGQTLFGVNDIVVDKSRSARVMDVETYINGTFAVTYRGDGLIISTPTGSTAYALSNGGPIVTPTSQVIGITPIAPHTLSGRPLIVPDTDTIRVVAYATANEVLLSADGQETGILEPPIEIFIRKAPHTLRLVKCVDRSYYEVLRGKLLWGKDVRQGE
ncbi:MAG: NAD(+)/NADH kinase [Bacteroidetes bacterium]|nr:NAD(+)/NADH kinase [Bacteroidota bacterium]MCW5897100.1 NAD(+)/NADH kinase [Bacteroidota bacterium]